MYRHGSHLYFPIGLPNMGFGSSATGFAGGYLDDILPKDFEFKTPEEYSKKLVVAVGDLSPLLTKPVEHFITESGERVESFLTPIRGQLALLESTIMGSLPKELQGIKLGEVVAMASAISNLSSSDIATVALAVKDLIVNGIAIASSIAVAAGVVVSAALSWVPVIGQIVAVVIAIVAEVVTGPPIAQAECDLFVENNYRRYCEGLNRRADSSFASKATGKTPADLFRPIAYVMNGMTSKPYGHGLRLPPTTMSMYVGLCAGETRGLFDGYGNLPYGPNLSTTTKRRMWKLIQAIVAALQPTDVVIAKTDGGVGAFTLLQEIVRGEWRSGRLSEAQLAVLNKRITGSYSFYASGDGDTSEGYSEQAKNDCAGHLSKKGFLGANRSCEGVFAFHIDLLKQLRTFERSLYDGGNGISGLYNPKTETWNAAVPTANKKPVGLLALNSAQSASLMKNLALMKKLPGKGISTAGYGLPSGLLTGLGIGAAGLASWHGVRHFSGKA